MISVIEARDIVLSRVQPLGFERVDLFSALGRILAEDIYATRNQPPWDNSAMDGYAVRSADTLNASSDHPVTLEIIEHLPAGYRAQKRVEAGQSIHIMTGAPIPEGVDTIIRKEYTELIDDTHIHITTPVSSGQDFRKKGEDLKSGDLLISAGKRIRPAEIGILASNQRSFITVYRRPRVAILSTGDEIVDVNDEISDGKIVDSNSYSLSALTIEAGAEPIRLGISRDEPKELELKLHAGLYADIILTSGGISVGEFDYVKSALLSLGTSMEFWKVAMTPGRPLAFGTIQNTLIFGLPGNPVASMVTFELFVRPALLKMGGSTRLYRPTIRAKLSEDIQKSPGRKQFIRMQIIETAGQYLACRTGSQGSGILRSMLLADGLGITHEHQFRLKAGEEIEVMLLGGEWEFASVRSC